MSQRLPSQSVGYRVDPKDHAESQGQGRASKNTYKQELLCSHPDLFGFFQTSSVAHVSGQPLRMQFTRIFGDCWNSRFITAAPGLGIERETPPSACPASQENGEQTHSQVPWTVLYEDLQVSSSSEDSDGD